MIAIFEDDRVCLQHLKAKFEYEEVVVIAITSADELTSDMRAVVLDWWVPASWEPHRVAIMAKADLLGIPKCIYSASPRHMIAPKVEAGIAIIEKTSDHAGLLQWISQLPQLTIS